MNGRRIGAVVRSCPRPTRRTGRKRLPAASIPVIRLFTLAALVGGLLLGATGAQSAHAAGCVSRTYYVTERIFQAVARVVVDTSCHATVNESYVTNLPFLGPDAIIFDHQGRLLISNTDAGTISVIDESNPNTGHVVIPTLNTSPLAGFTPPPNLQLGIADLALDPKSNTVWAIQYNGPQIATVDTVSGATNTSLNPSNIAHLGGIAFNATGSRLFVTSHDGYIYEISPADGSQIGQPLALPGTPDGITLDPTTGHLFISGCAANGTSTPDTGICEIAIGLDTNRALSLVKVHNPGFGYDGLAADGQGNIVMVNFAAGTLNSLNIATDIVTLIAQGIPTWDSVAIGPGGGGGGTATPELGSGELFATGLLPIGVVLFYRRRRARRRAQMKREPLAV